MNSQPFEYIKRTYNVPADIGRRVVVNGKPGIIAEDRGHYIGVEYDSQTGVIYNCHPTWNVEYVVTNCVECDSPELYTGGEIKEPRMCITCFAAMTGFTRVGDHFFDSDEVEPHVQVKP